MAQGRLRLQGVLASPQHHSPRSRFQFLMRIFAEATTSSSEQCFRTEFTATPIRVVWGRTPGTILKDVLAGMGHRTSYSTGCPSHPNPLTCSSWMVMV